MKSEKRLRVSVDIDNTLLNFAIVLHRELLQVNPGIPSPYTWRTWDFWKDYISKDMFYECVDRAQRKLPESEPFLYVKEMLDRLSVDFVIIITSHRQPVDVHYPIVKSWLDSHGLQYDEIWLSTDKTEKLNQFDLIIDDSPIILRAAAQAKIPAIGLVWSWNMLERNTLRGIELYYSVLGLIEHINRSYGEPDGMDVKNLISRKLQHKKQSVFRKFKNRVKRFIRKIVLSIHGDT